MTQSDPIQERTQGQLAEHPPVEPSQDDPAIAIQQPASIQASEPRETRFLKWLVIGPQGLRVGWSVVLFLVLSFVFMGILGALTMLVIRNVLHHKTGEFNATSSMLQEGVQFLGLLAAAAISALIEKRRILAYNLTGPNRLSHFLTGFLGGFVALSALVGVLYEGHWLQFGAIDRKSVV